MKKHIPLAAVALIAFISETVASIQTIDLVNAARSQIGRTLFYDPSYQAIGYPNGDVSLDRGVCTDVVVRALRVAYGYDLQECVHKDMKKHFGKYPQIWGLSRPDTNIDHRRVPNLQKFFERKGWSLPLSNHHLDFKPGDMVTCIVPPNRPHIMIVSDRRGKDNIPLVIHNIGGGTQEEDRLFEFDLTGHYRLKKVTPCP
jgi:uncharacterized protein YijF (DUF1287 family)